MYSVHIQYVLSYYGLFVYGPWYVVEYRIVSIICCNETKPISSTSYNNILVSGVDEDNFKYLWQSATETRVSWGHIIDKNGLHPSPEKIKAIAEAPTPKNVNEMKSFLVLIHYYNNFFIYVSLSSLQVTEERYSLVLVGRSREGIQTS